MYKEKIIMPAKDLRKLQLIELEMLLELDRICRKNNVKYFLSAGTALGAVRHKGFIPWDDDLDVRMERTEYERFCEICKTQLNTDRFFLQNDKTDKEYRWGYAKMRRKGTEYLRAGQEVIKCFGGVSIDIFVIDNVPDNLISKFFYRIIRRLCIKTLWSVVGVTEDPNPIKRFIYRGVRHINKRIPLSIMEWMGKKSIGKETEYVCCTAFYRKNEFNVASTTSTSIEPVIRTKTKAEWFKDCIELEFEGFLFYICKDYDIYLSNKYGDYWHFPPESLRYIHPPVKYFLDVEIDLRGRNIEEYMNKEHIYLTCDI